MTRIDYTGNVDDYSILIMATLKETAYYSRMFIKYFPAILVVLIVGRVLLGLGWQLWLRFNPPPPPPPTVGFGTLPPIDFPVKERPEYTYSLETVSGTLVEQGVSAPVYLMPVKRPSLLAYERAVEQAELLGFVLEPKPLTERLYRFSRSSPLPARLDFDIVTGNLDLRVDWFKDPQFLQEKELPSMVQSISESHQYLQVADLLPNDLINGEVNVTYLKALGENFQGAVSLSEADFVQVDLFRESPVEGFPIITPIAGEGVVRIIFSGSSNRGARVVWMKYDYFPIDLDVPHTYPIKTPQAAWEELVQGGGYIVSGPDETDITVRGVTLGYFDTFEPQNYLQPVYVFSGDDDFLAVVPAVESAWVQSE